MRAGNSASRPLIGINRNGSGELRLLDNVVSANRSISGLGGLVNANLSLPRMDGSSLNTPGGLQGNVVTSTQRDRVLGVNANLAQIAANAVGLPIPLAGKFGPIGYNLLQANAGLALDLRQTLQFTPDVTGRYVFSSEVVPIVNGRQLGATSVIDFRFGDDVTFLTQNVGKLSYQPQVSLGGRVRNLTEAVLQGSVSLRALGLDFAGLSLGPLLDKEVKGSDLGALTLFDDTYGLDLGTVGLPPITLDFNCTARFGSSEFSSVGICAESQFLDIVSLENGDGTHTGLLDLNSCSAHRLLESPTCSFRAAALRTSPYITSAFGERVFVNGGDALVHAGVTAGAGSNDESQAALLRELGYDPVRPAFVIPAGDSLGSLLPVPEPSTPALMLLGALLLATMKGRRLHCGRRRTGSSTPSAPALAPWSAAPAGPGNGRAAR